MPRIYRKPSEWVGLKFGRLTIIKITGRTGAKNELMCDAICECGKTNSYRVGILRDSTRSCGCLRDEINRLPTDQRPKRTRAPLTEEQKEKHKMRKLAWVKANPKKVAVISKRAREKDPLRHSLRRAADYQIRKPKIIARLNHRYATDIRFRAESLIRCRIRKLIRLRGTEKAAHTIELLGCSIDELIAHLEKLFLPGMSWENRGEWHIDHIRPCSSFDLTKPEEQRACFHFLNLQPLWGKDNLRKSAKLTWTIKK